MFAITAYGLVCHMSNKKRAEAIEARMAADHDWLDLTDKENVGFKYTTWCFWLVAMNTAFNIIIQITDVCMGSMTLLSGPGGISRWLYNGPWLGKVLPGDQKAARGEHLNGKGKTHQPHIQRQPCESHVWIFISFFFFTFVAISSHSSHLFCILCDATAFVLPHHPCSRRIGVSLTDSKQIRFWESTLI